jgi:hypothetical protein
MLRAYDLSISREVHNEILRINRREGMGVDQFTRTLIRKPQVLKTGAGVIVWSAEQSNDGVPGLTGLYLREIPLDSMEPRK